MPKHASNKPVVIVTTLGPETSFNGKLKFSESLKIRGTFEGEIEAKGVLYIDEPAKVTARIVRASSIIVSGQVKGDLEAVDKIEMLPTARVYGNVRTTKLRIADGVVFEGRCDMIRSPDAFNPFISEHP
ncbi:MAG: polymer-forming cytoskeletal protein [Spirochaetes bacterium]|nr:polymer-forming cytoskeletal protein [Spirochaetota bacterium]